MRQVMSLDLTALQRFLDENDISEAEFASKIGVAHSTVNRVLNGKRNAGGKFISGLMVILHEENLDLDKVFIFNKGLPKGKSTA